MRDSSRKVSVDLGKPSHYHAPKSGILRPFLHRLRMRLIYRFYKGMLFRYGTLNTDSVEVIAEVGCGPGYLLEFMECWFPKASIIGLDYDPRLLAEASERTTRARLIQGNGEELPFADAKFKALISLHLVEHLYYPGRMIDEACRVLKNDGIFILATPNPMGVGARFMGSKWSGWRKDHISLKPPEEWGRLLHERGFTSLRERTTLLTGIPVFRKFPLTILNWGMLVVFGSFPWKYGEAYVSIWQKE